MGCFGEDFGQNQSHYDDIALSALYGSTLEMELDVHWIHAYRWIMYQVPEYIMSEDSFLEM